MLPPVRPTMMKSSSRTQPTSPPRSDLSSLKWLTVLLFLVSILAIASQAAVTRLP